MRLNIQTKLFITLAGMTIIILAGVLYLVTDTLTKKIEEKIIADFNNTQRVFSELQFLVYDRLIETCGLIGENSTFKANVGLNDPATVYFSVDEFAQFAKVDLFVVTDSDGNVLARFDDPENYGDNLADSSTVFKAMNGIQDSVIEKADLWGIGSDIFQVVSNPIYAAESIIGTITLGTLFGDFEAQQLKGESQIDINFFYNDQLVGSSFENPIRSGIQRLARKNKAVIDTVMMLSTPTPAFVDSLKGVEQFVFISPLGQGARAYYIATIPTSIELSILKSIQNNILVTAGIFLLVTLIFAFLLGKNFSRPIKKLASGMDKVKAGYLDISVAPSTKDEIGTLTKTFNEMVTGLRERLHLTKYVGSHTLEMVQQSSGSDVSLGGTRQDLTVLFSDIRGFTAYSENRDPEEVINMLNRYLGFQAEIVARYDGSVDKYVGDEMFALFTGDNSTERALQCAIDIQKRVVEEHENDPVPIYIGIGINYGPVILGNMGAMDRMDYTALGSTVNLGARLCGSAKAGKILIRKDLLDQQNIKVKKGDFLLMAFKGISQKLKIVEVLSE
ncbi:MAG: HAMP domain-containing protein [Calditrichaeota bacterium]|nr:MAG: HAMP domain-containing protein [Calditrichota bacterium]MBL1207793.1 HAMP domain-containing protein [Calditrichota bacterium]NOG47627.1 HAMP domain-containing protein [Calditrichota bacterium]